MKTQQTKHPNETDARFIDVAKKHGLPNDPIHPGPDNPKATPNKAQPRKQDAASHSPLPWRVNDISPHLVYAGGSGLLSKCVADCAGRGICFTETDKENARLIVASVNHADKLAEALREIQSKLGEHEGKGDRRQGEIIIEAYYKTKEALAAWESAQ